MIPPEDPWRRTDRPSRAGCRSLLAMLSDVLAREALAGLALWAVQAADGGLRPLLAVGVLAVVAVGTHRFGLNPVKGWQATLAEVLLVFLGGLCMANLLAMAVGAPWAAPAG